MTKIIFLFFLLMVCSSQIATSKKKKFVKLVVAKTIALTEAQNKDGTTVYKGLFGKPFNDIIEPLRRNYNESEGTCDDNFFCTGARRLLQTNEADIFFQMITSMEAGPFKLSPAVSQIEENILTFISSDIIKKSEIKNFSLELYMLIMITILCCCIPEFLGDKIRLSNLLLKYGGRFVNQYSSPKKTLLHISTVFGSFIIVNLFMNSMSTDMVIVDDSCIINTFDQLEESDLIPIIKKISPFKDLLYDTSNIRYPKIKKRLEKYNYYVDTINDLSFFYNAKSLDQSKIAIIAGSESNEAFANFFAELNNDINYYFSKETIFPRLVFYLLSLNISNDAYDFVMIVIPSLIENGLWQKIFSEIVAYFTHPCYYCQVKNIRQLFDSTNIYINFANIRHMFIAPLMTLIFSCILIIVENIFKPKIKFKKTNNFQNVILE